MVWVYTLQHRVLLNLMLIVIRLVLADGHLVCKLLVPRLMIIMVELPHCRLRTFCLLSVLEIGRSLAMVILFLEPFLWYFLFLVIFLTRVNITILILGQLHLLLPRFGCLQLFICLLSILLDYLTNMPILNRFRLVERYKTLIIHVSLLYLVNFIKIYLDFLKKEWSDAALSLFHHVFIAQFVLYFGKSLNIGICHFTVFVRVAPLDLIWPLYAIKLQVEVQNENGVNHVDKRKSDTTLCS